MNFSRVDPFTDVVLVEPDVFGDQRGFFLETWERDKYAAGGIDIDFVQDNHSRSAQRVLRGLHFQHPTAQAKLLRVMRGAVWDVVVDVRIGSLTYGRWAGVKLSAETHHQIFVPRGFAHGFVVLSTSADVAYKVDAEYRPAEEFVLSWADPDVGVTWPIDNPLLAERDAAGLRLAELRDAGVLPRWTG